MINEELLKENGWEIECESPFEIRHEDGSFASMQAAHAVVYELEMDKMSDDIYSIKQIYKFTKNDWDHFHDVVLGVTWDEGKVNLNLEQMKVLFLELPEDMQVDALKFGMNDTCWRDSLWEWYKENKL